MAGPQFGKAVGVPKHEAKQCTAADGGQGQKSKINFAGFYYMRITQEQYFTYIHHKTKYIKINTSHVFL